MDPDAARRVGRAVHGGAEDPTLLDFSANVNPRTPDGVESVYQDALAASRRYPPEPPSDFCEAAASALGCAPGQVVPTPGGLAAIRLAVEATLESGDSALLPAPSFAEFAREVRLAGADPTFVDEGALLDADPTDHALAVVCNPNNPTGRGYEGGSLRGFASRCREADTTLLVDEAFLGYTDRASMAGEPGVVVARSLTKLYGLPGLRAGYAVATGDALDALVAARPPWNLGTPARRVGTYCLRQRDFVAATRDRTDRERTRMRQRLEDRFDVFPSVAPFLLLDVGERDVDELITAMADRDIAIRDATTFRGLDAHVRIAVRTASENDRLLEALSDV